MSQEVNGIVKAVYIAGEQDTLVSKAQEQLELTFEGVLGDKHYGMLKASDSRTKYYPRGTTIRNYRQVSIVSVEEIGEVARKMNIPALLPEWLGANLLLEGIPQLTFLPPSTRLFFAQGSVLVVNGENNPCLGPGKIIQEIHPSHEDLASSFVKNALHLRGIVAWVERPGLICPGDSVRALIPEQRIYSNRS